MSRRSRRLDDRQAEIKHGPFADAALGPGAATVTLHDAPHIGETDPGAFELSHAVQPLEDTEKFAGILHVETRAIVADEEFLLAGFQVGPAADLDARRRGFAGIL